MNKKITNTILITASILFIGLGAYYLSDYNKQEEQPNEQVTENQDQIDQVQDKDSEDSDEEEYVPKPQNDSLIVDMPREDEKVASPLTVSGQAKGTWYFEGTFPVVLTDWDGKIIAEAIAQAEGEWMTEQFVPFEAELTFDKPELYDRGSLILQKANPSDLPENDAALEYTVYFE